MALEKCKCVRGRTKIDALKELGIPNPIHTYIDIRNMLLVWYGVEDDMELKQYHPDAAACLSQMYRLMNNFVEAKMIEIRERPNPECWLCEGTGQYDPEKIDWSENA